MGVKLTKEEYIKRASDKHNNFYDYSDVEYNSSHDLITIKCPLHGAFKQRAYSHLTNGQGCRECGLSKIGEKKRNDIKQIKKDFVDFHGDKYDYSLFTEYKHKDHKIKIICKKHGIFEQSVNTHRRSGCKKCSDENKKCNNPKNIIGITGIRNKNSFTKEEILKIIANTYTDKYTFNLLPDETNYTKKSEIAVYCNDHDNYETYTVSEIIKGSIICSKCKKEESEKIFKDRSFNKFLKIAKEIYGDRFEYSVYDYEYRGELKFTCKHHGLMKTTYYRHLDNKLGCIPCEYKEYFDKYEDLYGDLYEYDYSSFIKGNIDVTCKKHNHKFRTNLDKLLTKGCMHCIKEMKLEEKKKLSYKKFIKKVSTVHKDRGYTYDYNEYDCLKGGRIKFNCPKHGIIDADRKLHENGSYCISCYKENNNNSSYIRESYVNSSPNGSNIYLVNLKSDSEQFYKIGISKNIERRMKDISLYSNYDLTVIDYSFNNDAGIIWDLEHVLHKKFKEFKYTPNEKFAGYTECFKLDEDQINDIIMIFKENINNG